MDEVIQALDLMLKMQELADEIPDFRERLMYESKYLGAYCEIDEGTAISLQYLKGEAEYLVEKLTELLGRVGHENHE